MFKTMTAIALSIAFAAMPAALHAMTAAVSGGIEETAVRVDQMTADACAYVYNCSNVRFVSIRGKNGQISAGSFNRTNLKAAYANNAQKAEYSDFTEKASWAETGYTDQTKHSAAFSANFIYNQIADEAYHSGMALGGDTAPAADQALVALYSAQVVHTLVKTDFYAVSGKAVQALDTSYTFFYSGGYLFDQADTAGSWTVYRQASY